MVDEKELRVIHYTLGPLKPWDWWTSWLLKPVDVWQVHVQLIIIFWHVINVVKNGSHPQLTKKLHCLSSHVYPVQLNLVTKFADLFFLTLAGFFRM